MERRTVVLTFLAGLLLCAAVTKPRVLSWNDASRVATIDALVAHRTLAIDESPFARQTRDKISFRGRMYSDKPPLLSLQGAAVAAVLRAFGVTLERMPATVIYLVTLFSVGVWYGLGCAYAFRFQRALGYDRPRAIAVTGLTALGTLMLPYATVLSNHVPCGAAALAGSYHVFVARQRVQHVALGSAFFGLAWLFDASAIVFAVFAALLLSGAPRRTWLLAAVVYLPFLAVEGAYNFAISGSLEPPALNSALWTDSSLPWQAGASSWIAGLRSDLRCALEISIGGKGLIVYTPLTLVCAYGALRMWRAGGGLRRLAVATSSTLVLYVVLIATYQNVDAAAQNFGERRYVDILPIVFVALGPAFAALRPGPPLIAARLAALASIGFSCLGVVAPFGGTAGEPGYVFAPAAFRQLALRAPLASAVDLVLLVAALVVGWRLTRPRDPAVSVLPRPA